MGKTRRGHLLAAVLLSGAAAVACTPASTIDPDVESAATAVAQTPGPSGFEARAYPTNSSIVDDIGTVPVEFTGALTHRNSARIVYVSRALPNAAIAPACQEISDYLTRVATTGNLTWQPPHDTAACVTDSGVRGGSVPSGTVTPTWTSEGTSANLTWRSETDIGGTPDARRLVVTITITRNG